MPRHDNLVWNRELIVLARPADAPNLTLLNGGAKVPLTIDSDQMPHKVLLIRGSVRTDVVDGCCPSATAHRAAPPSLLAVVSP